MARDLRLALRIQADLGQTPERLKRLKGQLGGVAGGADAIRRQSGPAARGLRSLGTAARDAGPFFGRAGGALKKLDFAVAGLAANLVTLGAQTVFRGLTGFASGIVESGLKFQALDQRLTFAVGPERAARAFAFVRGEAERLGLNLLTAGEGFSKLTAAAKGTALAGAQTREIFSAVSEAGRVLGLSGSQVAGAFTAIEQIISKGKVSAEELRGQLGERLVGAFQQAAQAMGLTTEELDKQLAQGQLQAEDFLPKLAAQLRRTYSASLAEATGSAAANIERMHTAVANLQHAIAQSGLLGWLSEAAGLAARIVNTVAGTEPPVTAGATARELRALLSRYGAEAAKPTSARGYTSAVQRVALEQITRALTETLRAHILAGGGILDDKLIGEIREQMRRVPDMLLGAATDVQRQIEQVEYALEEVRAREIPAGLAGGAAVRAQQEAIRALTEALTRLRQHLETGGQPRAFERYATFAGDASQAAQQAIFFSLGRMESALTEFVTTGKANWQGMVDAMLADLTRLVIRQAVLRPLAQALGLDAGIAHTGGLVGALALTRHGISHAPGWGPRGITAAGWWAQPIIARRGSGVFTPEQMAALGPGALQRVEVRLDNRGTPQRATTAEATLRGDRVIIGVVLEDLQTRGPIARSIETLTRGRRQPAG